MSKLLDDIRANIIDKRVALPTGLNVTTDVEEVLDGSYPIRDVYNIGIEWGFRSVVAPEEIQMVVDNCMRSLREHIYGDLRDHVLELERAIYNGNQIAARKKISCIMKEVFG